MSILSPGTRIGPYEIASRPMMGGMGVVYFALDHGNDGRPVALKTFRPELLPDRAARDRFLREGTAWVELGSHPHIVRCYKVEYIDPTAFLVIELIAKEQNMPDASLRSWLIPGHPLPIEQALLFALQIARGMQHANEKIPGFVHRDLKPENILVGADMLPNTNINRLRVTDFGLVKTIADGGLSEVSNAEESNPKQVQFTRGVGTPLYMAPEQWKGDPVGVFTDVYAFGCILYEMLSGRYAANGKTIRELQAAHCDGRIPPIRGNFSRGIKELVTKCLSLNPDYRYQTWNEVIDELARDYTRRTGQSARQESFFTDASQTEPLQVGWSFNAIGSSYFHLGKIQLAVSYFEKALANARAIGDHGGELWALGSIGNAEVMLGNVQGAIKYYEQALTAANEIGDKHAEGGARGGLGLAYEKLGDFQRAIVHQKQYLAIARKIGDRHEEGTALGNLGSIYLKLGDERQALDYFEQELAIARGISNQRQEGRALANLGNAHSALGDKRRAIGYFEQGLEIARAIGDRDGEGSNLGSLGLANEEIGNGPRAIGYYEQALAVAQEIGDLNGVATSFFNMALHYAYLDETDRSLPLALEAERVWAQIGSPYSARAQELIAALQDNDKSAVDQEDPVQDAFDAFQRAESIQHMQLALDEYPFMTDTQFILRVEKVIQEQVLPEDKPAFKQRLAWLKQLAKN